MMPKDTFICGNCQETFTELGDFVSHKQQPCSSVGAPASNASDAGTSQNEAKLIQLHVDECGQITSMTTQGLDEDESKSSENSTLAFLNSLDMNHELASGALEAKDGDNGKTTHLIILNRGFPERETENGEEDITLLNNVNLENLTEGNYAPPELANNMTQAEQHTIPRNDQPNLPESEQTTKKRRGRGKAGESKNKTLEAVPPTTPRPSVPETGADGKLICPQCKRSFAKERHFNTHKCLASSSYVDITKKEMIIDSGEEDSGVAESKDFLDEDIHDTEDKDFTATVDENSLDKTDDQDENEFDEEDQESKHKGKKRRRKKRKRSSYQFEVDLHKDNDGAKQMKQAAESLETLPIFRSDKEKSEFETCVDVDLSQVDHMFRIHIIEQELSEVSGMNFNTPTMSSLSVYSCNVCEKVFKSLSHIRLHCITHTEIKPFVCTKCSYATNSKGNLYTHMRKHTGQFYRCDKCDFKTVNKSHLVEHQMIHSNRRSQCLLCQKDYSTLKSLINHIRKYHINKEGRDYLQTFLQGRGAKGTTVIHQCHVCNRKFKKRIDRDRHLFIHDIKDLPHVQQCELCGYWASRKSYLDKHYQKHRVIYCCSLCDEKFLSTVRLSAHLTSQHSEQGDTNTLLTECINKSLYLPEPLVSGQEGSEYVYLPLALRETSATVGGGTDSSLAEVNKKQNIASNRADTFKSDSATSDSNGVSLQLVDGQSTVRLSAGLDRVKADMSDKLDLERVGVQQHAGGTAFDLEDNMKVKDELMLMLQNPGSDVDHEDSCELDGDTDATAETPTGEGRQEMASALIEPQPGTGDTEGADQSACVEPTSEVQADVEVSKEEKIQALIQRLGYRKMSSEIFTKLRETFGKEECEYCGRLFHTKAFYEPHLRTHTGDKPFGCANCSFRANTKEQLRKHREREHEKIAFQCKECDFLAPTRTRLWNHQLKHLGIHGLTCPKCPSKFDGMKHLRAHILNSHKDMDKEAVEKLTGFRHKATGKMGRRSFKCPHCPRVFIRANSELQKHIWIHEGIKPYSCPICPYACRSKNNLQAHMLRHSAEKPFSCSECGKEYKSKTALRWHIRSHKTGKQFKCDKCSYEATQASHLKRHMETHEVLKRFICKHCDYSANTLGYMKIHYAKHHKGEAFSHDELVDPDAAMSDKRVYKCLSCGYLFGNISDLKRHLKIRHHVLMQDLADMNQMQVFAVEVAQYDEASGAAQVVTPATGSVPSVPTQPQPQATVLHAPEGSAGEIQLQSQGTDNLPQGLSAVSLIQHIMGLSQGESQVQVVSEDGQPLEIGQDAIVVGQDGQLLLSGGTDGTTILPGNQYIIQYYNPEEMTQPTSNVDNPGPSVHTVVSADPSQHQFQVQEHQQQTQQLVPASQNPQVNAQSHPAQSQYIIGNTGGSLAGSANKTFNSDLSRQYIINGTEVAQQGFSTIVSEASGQLIIGNGGSNSNRVVGAEPPSHYIISGNGSSQVVIQGDAVVGQMMALEGQGQVMARGQAPETRSAGMSGGSYGHFSSNKM